MKFIQHFKNTLGKEYYFLDKTFKANCYKSFIISSFFVVFLLLFNQNDNLVYPWRFFAFSGYGFVIFIPFLFSFYYLPKYFFSKLYNNLNLATYLIWLTITILATYMLSYAYCLIVINQRGLTIVGCLSFMKHNIYLVFPFLMIILLLDYISSLKNKIYDVSDINYSISEQKKVKSNKDVDQLYTFQSDNKSENLVLHKSKIRHINGADNYVEVHFLNAQNNHESKLIRSKIKTIEEDANNDFLIKTHRSYLCNLKNVATVSKNAGSYFLHFESSEAKVPVSTKYSETVLNALNTSLTEV
jgi:hypothetical protein